MPQGRGVFFANDFGLIATPPSGSPGVSSAKAQPFRIAEIPHCLLQFALEANHDLLLLVGDVVWLICLFLIIFYAAEKMATALGVRCLVCLISFIACD